MKNELKNYMDTLKNNNNVNNDDTFLDSNSNTDNFFNWNEDINDTEALTINLSSSIK